MLKNTFLILFICILFGCSKNGGKNYLGSNGYDKITWNSNIDELKKTINEIYAGNLYEYFTHEGKNSISYHFHSGNFFNEEVELWDAEYKDNKFVSLKIYFKPKSSSKKIFDSVLKTLEQKKTKFGEKKKSSLFCTFYNETLDKPITKLTLDSQKIKDTEVVVLTLINLN